MPSLSLSYLLFLQAECDCTRLWPVTAASSPSQVNFTGKSASKTCAVLGYSQGRVVCGPGVLPATLTTLYLLIYDVWVTPQCTREDRKLANSNGPRCCRDIMAPVTQCVEKIRHQGRFEPACTLSGFSLDGTGLLVFFTWRCTRPLEQHLERCF